MAYFQNADIPTMLEDWDNVLTAGSVSAACLFEERDLEQLEMDAGGGQITHQAVATIRTTDFPDLQANDALSVDGIDYTVWRRLQLGDGALTELWLRVGGGS